MALGNYEEISLRKAIGDAQLIQLELVLSKIKAESVFFEEDLWDITRESRRHLMVMSFVHMKSCI